VALAFGIGLAFAGGGGGGSPAIEPKPEPKPDPKPDPKPIDPDPPKPVPDPVPVPQPPEPPPGAALQFDLEENWGGIPMDDRKWFARLELALRIPGVGRALAVKAWQAFRAGKNPVTPAEAATIAAANPNLCRMCFNPGDGPDSAAQLANAVAPKEEGGNQWPVPKDFSGWAAGSYGLFDILGATAVYAGIHQKFTPLLDMPSAAEAMKRWDVQGFAAGYIIWRLLYSDLYDVLVPGPNAPNGDSRSTWGYIFSAYAGPSNFVAKNGEAKAATERYLARAQEIGIDLTKVAYPWPPGTSYKPEVWRVKDVWDRLQDYKTRPVEHVKGKGAQKSAPAPQPAPAPVPPNQQTIEQLPGGVLAFPRIQTDAETAPLIIVMHGRGGDEKAMQSMIPTDLPARVFFLRGGLKNPEGGYLFFEPRLADPDAKVAPAIRAAGAQLVEGLRQLQAKYPTSRVFAVGFSQGAALAEYLGANGAVDGVYSHAGGLSTSLRPTYPAAVAVRLWHGGNDLVVPAELDAATAESFKTAGFPSPVYVLEATAGHRAPKPAEVGDAIGPLLEGQDVDIYGYGDPGITVEAGTCKMTVTDLSKATVALTSKVVAAARELAADMGTVKPAALADLVNGFLGDVAPYCILGDKPWADATSATRGYLATRALLRALVARGLMTKPDAVSMIGDVKAGAVKAGADAATLPALEAI
jgi:predicted esterase